MIVPIFQSLGVVRGWTGNLSDVALDLCIIRVFPVAATSAHGHVASGLTKREYLAAKMMAALVSTLVGNAEEPPLDLKQQSKSFAIAAVAYADALIAELNKPSLPSEVEL